jgi:phosphoribosyl 1,2-cyclic phosphate phosphodiesterase
MICFKLSKRSCNLIYPWTLWSHSQIDDIRPFNFKQGEIPVYAHQRVLTNLINLNMYLKRKNVPGTFHSNKWSGCQSDLLNSGNKTVIPVMQCMEIFKSLVVRFAYLTVIKHRRDWNFEAKEFKSIGNKYIYEKRLIHLFEKALDFITLQLHPEKKSIYRTHQS